MSEAGIQLKSMAWARLVRLPNLLTVPGDPLAGYLMACLVLGADAQLHLVWPVLITSLALYAAGLISNDIADQEEDRKDRPERPIASGAISARAAWIAVKVLIVLGLAAVFPSGPTPATVACILTIAVLAYNFALKRSVWAGPLTMGACRTLSFLLGASVAGFTRLGGPLPITAPFIGIPALLILFYVAVVTWVARTETENVSPGLKAWLPAIVIAVGAITLRCIHPVASRALWIFIVCFVLAVRAARKSTRSPERIPQAIGQWIGVLILIQAALCSMVSGLGFPCAAVLCCFWLANRGLARLYYSS